MEPFQGEVLQLKVARGAVIVAAFLLGGCINPFAPGLDNSPGVSSCDQHSIDGIFRCFQSSYTFRDTTLYGQLLDANFVFVYRNYDLGVDVSWGREEDLRTTYGLFQNAQKLDLIWNTTVSTASDSTRVSVPAARVVRRRRRTAR